MVVTWHDFFIFVVLLEIFDLYEWNQFDSSLPYAASLCSSAFVDS